jgi:exodeoxyribonuclease V beta subunit
MVMAMGLLATEGVRPRLLAYPDGDRRLTNLLHAIEVLHRAEFEQELGGEGLISWLAAHIAEPPDVDEYQLRLETDESAVQLVTIHRSKGLEYPVVFCPFAWEGVRKDVTPIFHRGDELILDLGSEGISENILLAREEQFSEDLRLLYVALTRAKFRCYLYWGRFLGSDSSALAYLLNRPSIEGTADPVEATAKCMSTTDDSSEAALLQRLVDLAGGAVTVENATSVAAIPVCQVSAEQLMLEPRPFNGYIDRNWRVTSFTGLTSSRSHATELPDRDVDSTAKVATLPSEPSTGGIFAFPRGAQAGTCLHAILEKIDFADFSRERLVRLTGEQLLRHGFSTDWIDTVAEMVENVVRAPLRLGEESVNLSGLLPGSWRPEMEFMLPLDTLEPEPLAALFRRHGVGTILPDLLDELEFTKVKGMMRGFIDLVFRVNGRYYLIDWKSNHLGNRHSDYGAEVLAEVMDRDFYTLQYHIYTVALHLFLSLRQPDYDYDRQFGGVFYLFLRGINPSSVGAGVFADRPDKTLVQEFADLLSPEKAGRHGQ